MRNVVYIRPSQFDEAEYTAASKHFLLTPCLTDLKRGDTVILRYSLLPFAEDVMREVHNVGARPLNTPAQGQFAAQLGQWYAELKGLTPRTWGRLCDLPDYEDMKFVLKGETNSRKNQWETHMFAENKQEAENVFRRLVDDSLIGSQQIYIREFVPLHTYFEGINGLPVTKEFRLFFYKETLLASGFYWQNYVDELPEEPVLDAPDDFIKEIVKRLSPHIDFYVVDIAETQAGEWIVVEVNDGSMSGLSCIDPETLYGNLAKCLF